ncbi:ExbD/TolR family protein [Flavobacterium sp.]|uniref:ExbD/TolR family protein n=1 Tax=Flavobacterium sp. TaxID=239 RepID=UPI00374D10FE
MAKAKSQKKAAAIDMTAMCDVAFLLLTFFILTATAKVPEPLPVDTPSSTVQTKLPDSDLAMLTIGNGKVFFGVTGKEVRIRTLELMGTKYGIAFSPEERQRFSLMDAFGVPMSQLKSLIAKNSTERNEKDLQSGIPKDSLDNQLKEWIYNARIATRDVAGKELKVAIKGDAKQEYPQIKKVIDILQDQQINQFNLVTGLRAEDF